MSFVSGDFFFNLCRFTQNLNVFRRELVDCLRSPAQAGATAVHRNGNTGLTVPGVMGIGGSPGSIDSIDSDDLPPDFSRGHNGAPDLVRGPGQDFVYIKFLGKEIPLFDCNRLILPLNLKDPPVFSMPLPVMSIFPPVGAPDHDKFEPLF